MTITVLLAAGRSQALSPELAAARAAVEADSALALYRLVLARDGTAGEGPEALLRLRDYFCFTRQADSLERYHRLYPTSPFFCDGLTRDADCWRVQLGVFNKRDNAFRFANRLRADLAGIEVLARDDRFLVVSDCFGTRSEARVAARGWKQDRLIDDYLVRAVN